MNKLIYWGLFFSPEELKKIGIDAENELHLTMEFFGNDIEGEIPHMLDARDFTVTVEAVGEYSKDGVTLNKGLRCRLPEAIARFFKLKVPHITTWVNTTKGEDGRPMGKAVDTWKCNWHDEQPKTLTGTVKGFYAKKR